MEMKKIRLEHKRLDSGMINLKKQAEVDLKWLDTLEESVTLHAETAADPSNLDTY